MERRREVRTVVNLPVLITELDPPGQTPERGLLKDVSRSGMLVRISHSIASGSLVKVETKDMMTVGEVIRCKADGNAFEAGLVLRHSVEDLLALIQ